ncbi:hypothetical protein [Streptomyces sioyaensis]|uniref:hypothetical protein n=1 Tax=Streptomyces sioyaensis TaxID=67364 RepID=UPI0036ED9FF4
MSTSTDASTVIGEAGPVGTVVSTDASPRNGAAPLVEHVPTGAGPATAGTGAPAVERIRRTEDTAAGERTADDGPPADDARPTDLASPTAPEPDESPEPPESWLRIEKGHAEPEEIAALSVVLCAQIAALRALAAPGEAGAPAPVPLHGRRLHAHRSACWSGCWSC